MAKYKEFENKKKQTKTKAPMYRLRAAKENNRTVKSVAFMTDDRTSEDWKYGSHFPTSGEFYESGVLVKKGPHYNGFIKLGLLEEVK